MNFEKETQVTPNYNYHIQGILRVEWMYLHM